MIISNIIQNMENVKRRKEREGASFRFCLRHPTEASNKTLFDEEM